MARAKPEELREFVRELKYFKSFVEGVGVMTNGRLSLLREGWQDEQYDKFKEQFDKTMKLFLNFAETLDKECGFLEKKAEELEAYEKYKYNI